MIDNNYYFRLGEEINVKVYIKYLNEIVMINISFENEYYFFF